MVDPKLTFAVQVRLIRTLLNMRQDEMGRFLGVQKETISAWETGYRTPSAQTKRLIVILAEREGLKLNNRGYPEYKEEEIPSAS